MSESPGIAAFVALGTQRATGEIKHAQALHMAEALGRSGALSSSDVAGLANYFEQHPEVDNADKAATSLAMCRMLHAAAEAMPDREANRAARFRTVSALLQASQVHLNFVADGRVLSEADRIGQQALKEATAIAQPGWIGHFCHRIGTLYLDTYTANRRPENLRVELDMWHRRTLAANQSELGGIAQEEWRLMDPVEALHHAEYCLETAALYRAGAAKAASLKARGQALEFLQAMGERVDQAVRKQCCTEALAEIGFMEAPMLYAAVLGQLSRMGEAIPTEWAEELEQWPMEQAMQDRPPYEVVDLYKEAALALQGHDAQRALVLYCRCRPLIEAMENPDQRIALRHVEARLLRDTSDYKAPDGLGLDEALAALRARARWEGWSKERTATALLVLANHSIQFDAEEQGLALMDEAVALAPELAAAHEKALHADRSAMLTNVAVNAYRLSNFELAIEHYLAAAAYFTTLGLYTRLEECLQRVADVLRDHPSEKAINLSSAYATTLGSTVGVLFPPPAAAALREMCLEAMRAMVGRDQNTASLHMLMHTMKGLRMGHAIRNGEASGAANDERLAWRMERVLEALSACDSDTDDPASYDQDDLLTAYVDDGELGPGKTPGERLENAQAAYDAELQSALVRAFPVGAPKAAHDEELMAALDERTVLVDLVLGRSTKQGSIGVYIMVFTRESREAFMASFPFDEKGEVELVRQGRTLYMHPFGLLVAVLRKLVRVDPAAAMLPDITMADLLEEFGGLFNVIAPLLARLREAGKDHLCIVPHGPLHFLPFHAIGPPNRPMATDWNLTYLPSTGMLLRAPLPSEVRRAARFVALGLSFQEGNPHGLSHIARSIPEATSVAKLFGTRPLLDEEATEQALLHAMKTSRWVHLSTHGRHHVTAPSFQCLYMHPDGDDDGCLFAYELLGHDLSGLEVLTMSACETTLGRFDRADDLRGLPAMLLLAGVRTIVGTMWEVEQHASERFFTAFYRVLNTGASRLDAFGLAQRETREHHPEYRDWGAFQLIGDWS
ncbi:MAG: CHAT domain-containing protein [Flavobacteriales bacterium]